MEGSIWLWVVFNLFVLGMLALDLGIFHRKSHAVSGKEALIWSMRGMRRVPVGPERRQHPVSFHATEPLVTD